MTSTIDDLQLVELLRQRDEEAFAFLVHRYGPQIRRWIARRVDDPFEIDDLVQEVLVATWRSSDRLRDDTVLPKWLKTIADNACRMRARTRARKPSTPIGLVPDEHDGADPVDVAAAIDVEEALRQLPEREAGILRLLYSEDRPLEEAAGILNLSEDAAKSLAARARRRFRSTFEAWFRVAGAAWVPLRFAEVADRMPGHSVRTGVAAASALVIAAAGAGGPIARPPAPVPATTTPRVHQEAGLTLGGGPFRLTSSTTADGPGSDVDLGRPAWLTHGNPERRQGAPGAGLGRGDERPEAPSRASTAPGKAGGSPGNADGAPGKADVAAGKADAAPGKADAAPAKAAASPGQSEPGGPPPEAAPAAGVTVTASQPRQVAAAGRSAVSAAGEGSQLKAGGQPSSQSASGSKGKGPASSKGPGSRG